MKPAAFQLIRASSLQHALELLSEHEDARPLAGGQSLVPMMNLRIARPCVLVDLNGIEELKHVRSEPGYLTIGALVRQQHLLDQEVLRRDLPLLAAALSHVGHLQTRNRGTVGGSLSHADPSAELPLSMVAVDATLTLASVHGRRSMSAREFFVDAMTTALREDELLVEIRCPVPEPGTPASFHEFARRHGDFAIAAACAQRVRLADGSHQLKGTLGGVQAVPYACEQLAGLSWRGAPPLAELIERFDSELAQLSVLSDHQASASTRAHLARQAMHRCIEQVLA